ncbi:MAG TPA: glycosyltransferase family 2 protein [Acidobacteriota bacterium]|nr:glycosyltransferase family 2 protein [Acidobacteriota bacterium]
MKHRLTIVIVSYNSGDFLPDCLESLYRETQFADYQVVVVDNASADRTVFVDLKQRFDKLAVLFNSENLGFAKACNQGIRAFPAQSYLLLNPDCIILDNAIEKCLCYLEARPEIGIVGCRVQNPDGSLQLACRRAIPRPSTALYRFTGLSRLFPRNKYLGRYNYSYLDDRLTHAVDAVSGSFLMFRSAVGDRIGLLDETFFLYGEDLDFCYRAGLDGWKVIYYPEAIVTHHKRRSSSQDARAANFHFYNAMKIFYRKHQASKAGRLEYAAVLFAIECLYRFALLRNRLLGRSDVGSAG